MPRKQVVITCPDGEQFPVWDYRRTSWVQRAGSFTLTDVVPDLHEMLVASVEHCTAFQLYNAAGELLWEGAGPCTFDPDGNGQMLCLKDSDAPWELVMPDNSGVVFIGVGRYPVFEDSDA